MDLFAYEPLLTTDGIRPVPKAVVGFYAAEDTVYSAPLEVYSMEGTPLGFSLIADEYGYVNNAGGYKLAVREAVSKSGELPAVPVYSVRSILEDSSVAAESAEASLAAVEQALALVSGDHARDMNNPHRVTKAQVGLGNVDNTSDANKPVSTAQQAALNLKLDASKKGVANGVASLGSDGKVPAAQLPSGAATTTLEGTYANRPAATTVPAGTVYYATNVGEQYRSDGAAWKVVGMGGSELGYAELASNFDTSSTAKVDVPGLSVTFIAGERPFEARVGALVQAATAGARPALHILLDGNLVAEVPNRIDPTANGYMIFERSRRLPPMTPGTTHTVKVQASSTGGNITVFGVATNPASLGVVTR